jgi:hypothetical protein
MLLWPDSSNNSRLNGLENFFAGNKKPARFERLHQSESRLGGRINHNTSQDPLFWQGHQMPTNRQQAFETYFHITPIIEGNMINFLYLKIKNVFPV